MRFVTISKALILVSSLSVSAGAYGHGDEVMLTGVYKERHDTMEAMKDALVSVKMMVTGKVEFDAAKVKEDAAIIAGKAGAPPPSPHQTCSKTPRSVSTAPKTSAKPLASAPTH